MRYANVKYNDIANAPGICVSFFVQGCPHHCYNCFNSDTWNFEGGKEFTESILDNIIASLNDINVHRDLCVLGGEPMCEENIFLTYLVITTVKKKCPTAKIYVWSGYTLEELLEMSKCDSKYKILLDDYIDCLIDGRYIDELRDITLPMRGSSNQRILWKGKDF